MPANATPTAKVYPDPQGTFGNDDDVLGKLFTVAYGLAERKAALQKEAADNRTAMRSLKSIMTDEQKAEVDALYHPTERGRKPKATA